ncbi:MAG TPA: hypothetical protein VF223_16920, partial [Trebonia sp.]
AQVSALATVSLAKSDDILAAAEAALAGSADEAGKQLKQQGRAAEDAGVKARIAGSLASGAGSAFGGLASPMGAALAAGVSLAPVILTVGTGLGGLALAAKSTIEPILQAGTATQQAQQALAGLDPAQKAAYRSLTALKGEFGTFGKALQPEVLGLFNKGLDTASGLLSDVEPVASAAGKALAGVLGQVDAEFRSGEFQSFFTWMAANAGPDVQLLGQLFVNLAADIPPVMRLLDPLAKGFLEVTAASAKAAGGGANLFESFVNDVAKMENKFDKLIGAQQGSEPFQQTADSLKKLGQGAASAGPQVGTLAGDMALLNGSTTNASTALSAYSDAWAKILGNSLSDQQAVLADESAFSALTTAVKNNGGQSLQARQAFVSYMQQVGTGISTLQQNGASVGAVNAEYEVNIRRLQGLHNLTPAQRSDIAGLVRDYDTWASSTAGLNKQTLTAAQSIKDNFTSGLKAAGDLLPRTNADVSSLAASILKTGTTSGATRGNRAALIADLERAGIDAGTATTMVDGLERRISTLKGKSVKIGADTNPAISSLRNLQAAMAQLHGKTVTVTVLQSNAIAAGFAGVVRTRRARGGLITAGTGPAADDVPAMLSRGETVVPAALTPVFAPAFAAAGIPGFASGGVAGRPAQVIPGGRGGGDVHVHLHNEGIIGSQQELERWLLEAARKLARTKGGGNVQTAFGRQ